MKKLFLLAILLISCKQDLKNQSEIKEKQSSDKTYKEIENDTIVKSTKHKFKDIVCNLDGDNLFDTVQIVKSTISNKYGLKIAFGNNKTDFLGMGHDVINQGFNDFNWIGEFTKVNKGETYWNNVNDEGNIIINESEVKDTNKITLTNDGIFVHQSESCGGGIIYFDNGKYFWIQQE